MTKVDAKIKISKKQQRERQKPLLQLLFGIFTVTLTVTLILFTGCSPKRRLKIKTPLGQGIYQANLLYQQANYEECRKVLENLLSIDPQDPYLHYNLGLTYARLNRYSQARDEYLKALRHKGGNIPQIHQGLADLYLQQRLYSKAAVEYQRAIALQPDSVEIIIRLASTYEKMDKMELAVKQYKSAIRVKASPNVYLRLGNIYYKLGQYEEATATYQKALRLDPNLPQVYNNLGLAFEKGKKPQEARACYQKAIQKDGRYLPAYINLGAFYQAAGEYELAKEQYLHALKINPNCLEALLNLGILYDLYLADPKEALRNYQQYCQAGGPRSSEVKRWIETLQSKK